MISDYERLLWVVAEEMESSIASCHRMITEDEEWVDSEDEAQSLMFRMRGIFIASLVGEVEELVQRKFASFFDQMSETPTVKGNGYWHCDMPKTSTPRGRTKIMWAIRIAYTHGNGNINQISDSDVAACLQPEFVKKHFRGVRVENEIVKIFGDVTYPSLKTALQIKEKFT